MTQNAKRYGPTDRTTDRRTEWVIESRERNLKHEKTNESRCSIKGSENYQR